MKYTLNENIKRILDERFILNEDVTTIMSDLTHLSGILIGYLGNYKNEDPAAIEDTKNIEIIRQELSALNSTLSSYKKLEPNMIDKTINKLSGQVLRSSDAAKIKGTTKEVLQRVETLLDASSIANQTEVETEVENPDGGKTTKPTKIKDSAGAETSVKDYLHKIKQLAASDDISKDTLIKIKENVAKISEIISLLSQKKNKNSAATKETKKVIENAFIAVSNLQKFIPKIGGADKFAELTGAKELMSIISAIVTNTRTEKNSAGTKRIDEQLQELKTLCDKTTNILDTSGISLGTDIIRDETIDWQDRFENAKDKATFWNTYYAKAWGSNGDKIRALGDPFRNECEKLGFKELTNPFITFIKKYIIKKGYMIGGEAYRVIHNAVATDKLDESILNNTAGDTLNILACKDLYTKSASELQEYLSLFNTVYSDYRLDPNKLFATNSGNINDPLRQKYFSGIMAHLNHDDKSVNQIAWLLLFNTIPLTEDILLNPENKTKLVPHTEKNIETAVLRKINEIKTIIKILNPEVSTESKKAFEADTIQTLIGKELPAAKETKKTSIGIWVLAMISQFLKPADQLEILTTYPVLDSIKPSQSDVVKHQQTLLKYGNSMTKDQVIGILKYYETAKDKDTKNDNISFK